ncbi:MAG: hypothetical protein P4N59_11410 [Negativicutes bacterium]|nr:hypothetical protein [Negativicutes bacterium]
MIECVPDFETTSRCDLKAAGSWRYSEDITTNVICLSFKWRTRREDKTFRPWHKSNWVPGTDNRELSLLVSDPTVIFIAHNTGFEKAIWRNIMVPIYGFANIPNSRWHDTMATCAMKVLPLELERAATVLRLQTQKDMEGRKLTLGLSRFNKKGALPVLTPEVRQRVIQYCEIDIDTQSDLHERIGYLTPEERQVWLLDQRINERGVKLDMDLVRQMQQVVDKASTPLLEEFYRLTGLGINQNAKVLAWVKGQGVDLPNMQKETLAQVLGQDIDGDAEDAGDDVGAMPRWDLPDNVHRVLHIRQLIGSSSIKKLGKMEASVCADRCARGLLQYHGAGPGRWSGRLLQPQNFPRGTILHGEGDNRHAPDPAIVVQALMTGDPAIVQDLIGPPVETVVSALRHVLIPRPGRVFVAGDFSGIQARSVLAVAGQHDKTALMAAGADVYVDMAETIYRRKITKKADPAERQVGKNTVLGAGFGMGAKKFRLKYCPEQPLDFAQSVVDAYRKEWAPCVPKLWYGLEAAAVNTVNRRKVHEAYGFVFDLEDMWLTCRLPSGRKIWYFNPQPTRRAMPWDENDIRPGFSYQAMKQGVWKTIDAFGGQLTENVICGIEADLMRHAMFKCEANGFPIVMLVHDEIVTEPLTADANVDTLSQIMCDSPAWCSELQIPVAIEGWIGDRYKK